MREDILTVLTNLAREERSRVTVGDRPIEQEYYSRPGRFIIDKRHLSDLSSDDPTLSVTLRTHPSGAPFPTHSHNFIEMMYVCRGPFTHVIDGERITLGTGDIIILGRNTSHSIEATTERELGLNLILSCDLLESILGDMRRTSSLPTKEMQELLDVRRPCYIVLRKGDDKEIKNLIENIVSQYMIADNKNEYILRQSFILLFSYLAYGISSEGPLSGDDIRTRLINYVKTSYSTATLSEAAEIFGLSVPYLSRWIVKNTGSSFKEMLMREKFSAACELLSSTDMPIGDVIRNIGYENSSYFHREFKKRYSITPYQYRKKHLSGS